MSQSAAANKLDQKPREGVHRNYAGLVPAAIVVAGLYFGRPVLLPLAIAIVLAFALAPIVTQLRRLRLGRVVSVLAAAVLTLGMVAAIGSFVGGQVVQLADQVPLYQSNLASKIRVLRGATVERSAIQRLTAVLNNLRQQTLGPYVPRSSPGTQSPGQGASPTPVPVEVQQPQRAPLELFIAVAKPLLEPLVTAGIVFVFVVFILLSKEDIRDRFITLAGARDMQRTTLLLDEGAEGLSRYLLAQAAVNGCFGISVAAGLWLIGLPGAMLWGLCVVVLRFVPYIGVPLGALAPIVLALSVDPGWTLAVETLAFFTFGEVIVGQAVEPWLYGKAMGLSPVAVVVSATFWTALWGPVGLLLSTPLTMGLVVLGRHVEHLKFLDVLLGDRPPLAADETLYLRMLGDDPDEAAAEAESFLKENSLGCYYNEVALKALSLADADINRGLLDHERALKIIESTRTLVENLSEGASAAAESKLVQPGTTGRVFCVGGRSAADEAAALLLVHFLEQAGIVAELIPAAKAREADIGEFSRTKVVCLCYLDSGNAARAAYLLRRIRRLIPRATPLAAFWGAKNADQISQQLGCKVAVALDEAVSLIAEACNATAQHGVAELPDPSQQAGLSLAG